MRRITNEQMRAHVAAQNASSAEAIKSNNETRSKAPRTGQGYKRDFDLLMDWSASTRIHDLKEEIFFACMEKLIGLVSKSRIENYRSATAFRQKLDIEQNAALKWTQSDGFLMRFSGLLNRADEEYKRLQACGKIRKTKRGAATIGKIGETMDHCQAVGETEYGMGIWLAYNALLRHKELEGLTHDSFMIGTDGVAQVRIVDGKGRKKGTIEWVPAPDCSQLVKALMNRTGLTFPKWDEKRANDLIQQTAVINGWEVDLHWVMHSVRRGMATDMRQGGMSIREIMEKGRWKSEQVALDYAGGDR